MRNTGGESSDSRPEQNLEADTWIRNLRGEDVAQQLSDLHLGRSAIRRKSMGGSMRMPVQPSLRDNNISSARHSIDTPDAASRGSWSRQLTAAEEDSSSGEEPAAAPPPSELVVGSTLRMYLEAEAEAEAEARRRRALADSPVSPPMGATETPIARQSELQSIRLSSEFSATGLSGMQPSSAPNLEEAPQQDAIQPPSPGNLAAPGTTPSQLERAGPEDQAFVSEQVGVLHQLLTNTFKNDGAGWATNLLHASARDGTITFLTTALREVVGKLSAQHLGNMPDHVKIAASSTVLAGLGILNVASAIRQEVDGSANWLTRSARLSTVALLGGASGVAYARGGLGSSAPLLIKATSYAAARDGINTFITLNDNCARGVPTSFAALAVNMIAYGVNQFTVNTLQGLGISHSGTSSEAQDESLRGAFRHIAAFSAGNALGEAADAITYSALVSYFDKVGQGLREGLAHRIREGERMGIAGVKKLRLAAGLRLPTGEDILNKVSGAMLPRASLFVILFLLLNAMSKNGPKAGLNAKNSEILLNAVAGASIALMYGIFVSTTATLARR
ncbi:hypothetical protein [Sinorhizobium medicae]|uniref:hypothetical protein n=1 Tax=Sinorhizobium medicae TaxID=110321 RepID=UPI00036EDD22|nr:hypothetical protein [Sinorhizobium medicae]